MLMVDFGRFWWIIRYIFGWFKIWKLIKLLKIYFIKNNRNSKWYNILVVYIINICDRYLLIWLFYSGLGLIYDIFYLNNKLIFGIWK